MIVSPVLFWKGGLGLLPNVTPSRRGVGPVGRDGIEPPTRGFSVLCSTD